MPKRFGNIWYSICDTENIRSSVDEVIKRRKQNGHYGTQEKDIELNRERVISDIQNSLMNRTYEFGNIFHTTIREGRKERKIDHLDVYHSIYLQAVLKITIPMFISKFIPTTYSSIKGRGLTEMSMDINRVIRKHPDYHFILIDEKKCYENVDHEKLLLALKRTFKDKYLLEFFDKLISTIENGVAIGYSTNHYFVNLLFSGIGHKFYNMKNVYIFQYMDDILLIAPKNLLPKIYNIAKEELDKIKQIIKPNVRFAPISYGIDFCGYIYYDNRSLLRKNIKLNMKRLDNKLRKENVPDDVYKQRMASYWGWVKYCNGINLWRSILKDKIQLFDKQMKSFSEIAQGRDRHESYEGEYWRKADIIDKEVEFIKFRKTMVRNEEKYIIQGRIDGVIGFFFSNSIGITDKLERYSEQLPFCGTIKELTNRKGKKFMTIV